LAKGIANLRFAVAEPTIGSSSVWRLWATRHGDVYLATYNLAGVTKFSFHRSGICRNAFTREHGPGRSMTDRVMHRWHRGFVPGPGSGQFCRLCWISYPTDYLSRGAQRGLEKSVHIPPAAAGRTTFVEVGLCKDSRGSIEAEMKNATNAGVVLHSHLIEETNVLVRWYHGGWDNRDLRMEPSHGTQGDPFRASELRRPDEPTHGSNGCHPEDGEAI